jgi:hypothetical protein
MEAWHYRMQWVNVIIAVYIDRPLDNWTVAAANVNEIDMYVRSMHRFETRDVACKNPDYFGPLHDSFGVITT